MADVAKNKFSAFYHDKDPELSDEAKAILKKYSGVPEAEQAAHVRAVRDKAWAIYQYPCIGQYSFIKFTIADSPQYADALRRLKAGQTLLDQACCFGQDTRRLIFDGAPAENVTGSELEQGFIDRGYDLFKDRDKLKVKFFACDFFDPKAPGLEEHSYDMIHAAAFFHLFGWAEQVEAWSKALRLLKPKAGSMVFGRQIAVEEAGTLKHPATRSGEMYRHNVDSFRELVDDVAEKTGIKLQHEIQYVGKLGGIPGFSWKYVRFCVTLR